MSLKGHTTIELTDAKTGKKENYEDDNMFTNALSDILNNPLIYPIHSDIQNGYEFYLGGIALFENTVDTSSYYAVGNTQIGYAIKDEQSTNDVKGTYNSDESSYDAKEKTLKLVYDFATNQCNGRISSVCLINKGGAKATYGLRQAPDAVMYYDYGDYDSSVSKLIKKYNIAYSSSGTVNKGCIWNLSTKRAYEFYKSENTLKCDIYELDYTNVDLFGDKKKLISTEDISTDTTTGTPIPTYDEATGKIYVVNCSFRTPQDIFEITIGNNDSLTVSKITFNKGYDCITLPHFHNGYFCAIRRSDAKVIKYDIHNLSNATELAGTADFTTGDTPDIVKVFGMGNAFIIGKPHSYGDGKFSFSHCADIIDMSSNTIKTTRLYNDSRSNDVGYIAELIYNGKLFSVELMPRIDKDDERLSLINPMYLTTINNLETPVVKTSDKTMKITYTITQTE
jgi:hypothetical protein